MILVVLLYALFGFSFTLGKVLVAYAQPLFAVGVRMITGGTILIGYILIRHKVSCYPRRADLKYYIRLIFFSIFIPYALRLWALQYLSTNKAVLLFSTAPFFTAILAYFVNKKRFRPLQIVGLVVGFLGMIPILMTGSPLEDHFANFSFISLPELAILVAVGSMSYGLITMQKLVKNRQCPPYLANSISMFFGGLLALNASFVFETNYVKAGVWPLMVVLALQVIISNVICANLQASLLRQHSPTFMSFASFLIPLFTSIYGMALFGETVTWHFFASFITVVSGLSLYRYGDKKQVTLTDDNETSEYML